MMKLIFPLTMWAICAGGPIALGFSAGHPIIGVLIAAFIAIMFYLISVFSQLAGQRRRFATLLHQANQGHVEGSRSRDAG